MKKLKRKTVAAKRVVKPRFEKKYKRGMKPKNSLAKARAAINKVPLKPKGAGFKDHNMLVTSSSKKHTWRTPQKLIDVIEKVAGKIQLDPCADANPRFQFAKTNYTGKKGGRDGLTSNWRGFGVVYSNPPYGRGSIVKWLRKAIREFDPMNAHIMKVGVQDHCFILVPARPDTKWFQEEVLTHMNALCFWKGRLKFSKSDPAPFPSLIIYIGPKPKRFKKIFRRYGWVIVKKVPK